MCAEVSGHILYGCDTSVNDDDCVERGEGQTRSKVCFCNKSMCNTPGGKSVHLCRLVLLVNTSICGKYLFTYLSVIKSYTVDVKHSTRGAYIEYDIPNFSMHYSTSTQNVLKVSCLTILCNWATHLEYIQWLK